VPGIIADHPHHTLAADYLTLLTNLLDAGSNLHGGILTRGVEHFRLFSLLDDLPPVGVILGKFEENVFSYK
jgi:hypothetical protein